MPGQPDHSTLQRDVGRRIAELRQELGWRQADLADRLEVSLRYVQSVEGGNENMTLQSVSLFAWTLDVDPSSLFALPRTLKQGPGRPKKTR